MPETCFLTQGHALHRFKIYYSVISNRLKESKSVQSDFLYSRLRQRPFFANGTAWVENPEAPQPLTVDG